MEEDGDTVDCKILRVTADEGDRLTGTNAFAAIEEQQMIIAAVAVVRGIGITVGVTGSGFSRGVKILICSNQKVVLQPIVPSMGWKQIISKECGRARIGIPTTFLSRGVCSLRWRWSAVIGISRAEAEPSESRGISLGS